MSFVDNKYFFKVASNRFDLSLESVILEKTSSNRSKAAMGFAHNMLYSTPLRDKLRDNVNIVDTAVPEFPHRPKERIPYLPKNRLADMFRVGTILAEKLDGALANIFVNNKAASGANSHRLSKKTGAPIDYTKKIPGISTTTLPESIKSDSIELKGELIILDRKGEVLPHQEISGILNSKPENAVAKLKEKGLVPRIALFDIRGDTRPYRQKLKDLHRIAAHNKKLFFVPETAETTEEKNKLIEDIKAGKNPRTKEGVVWEGSKKVKFSRKDTVYAHSTFDTKIPGGKYEGKAVGGLWYSLKPGGPKVGKIGTGFSDSIRKDIYNNPSKFIGKKVSIEHQGQYKNTGAYRMPVFKKAF